MKAESTVIVQDLRSKPRLGWIRIGQSLFLGLWLLGLGGVTPARAYDWSGWVNLGGLDLQFGPALATNAVGALEPFVIGGDGALWLGRRSSQAGAPSLSWESLGGSGLHPTPAVGRNADGRREAFAVGTGGVLYRNHENSIGGSWSGWSSMGSSDLAGPVTATVNRDNRLEVNVLGGNGLVYVSWQNLFDSAWSDLATYGDPPVKGFAVASAGLGRLTMIAVGQDGALRAQYQIGTYGWSGWQSLGGSSLTGSVALGCNAAGRLQAFVVGGDGVVYSKTQTTADNGYWSDWISMAHASIGTVTDVAVSLLNNRRLFLLMRQADGTLVCRTQLTPSWMSWDGAWSEPVALGGGAGLKWPVAIGQNANDALELWAGGIDGQLHYNWIHVAPANDLIADATVLYEARGSVRRNSTYASKEPGEPNHAGNTGGKSVWWTFMAPSRGQLTIDTFGSGFDTLLAAYLLNGGLQVPAEASNDDTAGHGTQSQITFHVNSGFTYAVAVDGYGGAGGDIAFNWTFKPDNDNFADATVLYEPTAYINCNNMGATRETGEPNHAGYASGKSVWYRWTAPTSGQASFDTLGSLSVYVDTVLAAYTGSSVDSLSLVAENDNVSVYDSNHRSQIFFHAVAGSVYHIAVDTAMGNPGGLLYLNWTFTPDPTPTNDNFADAIVLPGLIGATIGTDSYATKEAGEPNHAGKTGGKSVWWRWTAPATGTAIIDTFDSSFDTLLAAYTGSAVGSLTELAANDDSGGQQSRIMFPVHEGTEYQIAVDGYLGASGSIVLHWFLNLPPDKPTAVSPASGATGQSFTPLLQATEFSDPDPPGADSQSSSQWQVDDDSAFASPDWNSGESYIPVVQTTVPAGVLHGGTTYYWRVRYKDSAGNWSAYSDAFNFTTGSGNSSLTNIVLSASSVAENLPPGTFIGSLSTEDPTALNAFTYTLAPGAGGTDNGWFAVSGSNLLSAAWFNYEAKSNYSIRVQSATPGGLFWQKVFTVTILDVAEPPPVMQEPEVAADGGTVVIRWSSLTNHLYTVHHTTNLVTGFSVLQGGLPATPTINVYTDILHGASQKFWKVTTEP